MSVSVVLLLLVCFGATSLLLAVFLRTSISEYFIDVPNHRSAHDAPVSRIGGLALVPTALGIGLWNVGDVAVVVPCLIGLALFAVSLLDDRFGLPAKLRLVVHLGAAAVAVWFAQLSDPVVMVLVAVAIAWMTNLFNFMDGADGLAGGMAAFGFGAYGVAAWIGGDFELALVCGLLCAASVGFLWWNFPPAKIFLGDGGSISLGFLAGALGLLGFERGVWGPLFPVLVFLPFIFDATLTLGRRVLARKNIFNAHRDHIYQNLSALPGWDKRRLVLAGYGLMAGVALSALAVENFCGRALWCSASLLAVWLVVLAYIAIVTVSAFKALERA